VILARRAPGGSIGRPRRRGGTGQSARPQTAGSAWWAVPLAGPGLALLAVFFLYPIGNVVYHAFTNWDGINPTRWVGFANFSSALSDPGFWSALKNNAFFAAFVPVQVAISLAIAVLIYERPPGWRFLRAVFFLPVIMSPVVIGILWGAILGLNGPLNELLGSLGLSGLQHAWLANPGTSIPAIMVVVLWASFGFNMVLFLAGLGTLPADIIDAAHIDGARWWGTLVHVIVPSMRRSIELVTVLNLITAFAFMFPYIYVLTGGGPGQETYVVEFKVYYEAFQFGHLGYASAITVLLLGIVGTLMIAYIRLLSRTAEL
jgi:ABC-type sugar transport system permease subunit